MLSEEVRKIWQGDIRWAQRRTGATGTGMRMDADVVLAVNAHLEACEERLKLLEDEHAAATTVLDSIVRMCAEGIPSGDRLAEHTALYTAWQVAVAAVDTPPERTMQDPDNG